MTVLPAGPDHPGVRAVDTGTLAGRLSPGALVTDPQVIEGYRRDQDDGFPKTYRPYASA